MTVRGISVPPVTKEFADELQRRFRPITITPETSIEDIMYNAGMVYVVQWVQKHVVNKTVSSNIDILDKEPRYVSWLNKLFGK